MTTITDPDILWSTADPGELQLAVDAVASDTMTTMRAGHDGLSIELSFEDFKARVQELIYNS